MERLGKFFSLVGFLSKFFSLVGLFIADRQLCLNERASRCESEFVRFTKWQAHLNNHFLEVFASENFKEMIHKISPLLCRQRRNSGLILSLRAPTSLL